MKRVVVSVIVVAGAGVAGFVAIVGQALPVEMETASVVTVREYVADDAKTRLADEYIVDMPVSGTLIRIMLEVGDEVQMGQIVAHIDPYDLKQEILKIEAQIAQKKADVAGVDVAKPKAEDIESAKLHVTEKADLLEIASRTRAVIEINYGEAERSYNRAKGLLETGTVSESFFDEAEMRYRGLSEDRERTKLEEDAARKALTQAELARERLLNSIDDNEYQRESFEAVIDMLKAQLAMFQDDLNQTKIKAPVSGPVLEKFEEDQRVLLAGSPLLKIGALDSIEIECDVLSEEVSRMHVGNSVRISGKALQGRTLEGTVSRIYPAGFMKISALGVEQQRVRTLIAFDNADAGLRPGTRVDVEIITAQAVDALAVPDRAVFRHSGGWALFVVEGGRAVLTPVKVGLRNEDWAQILEGVTPETVVVSELKNDLVDGARVTPLD